MDLYSRPQRSSKAYFEFVMKAKAVVKEGLVHIRETPGESME